jgi:NodT family efflux transporter outer membrane factor (OMF) lipoprotein
LVGARASRRLASLDLLPTITGIGSTTRQQQSIAAVLGLTRQLPQQQYWDVGFDASWEIDIYGRVARNVRARQAYVASAEYSLEDVTLIVMAEVARSYFELVGAQQQLVVAQRSAETQGRILRLTEERLAAGRGTAFDTERAKAVLYLTLAATPALEAQIATSRERIAVLLGKTTDALPAALSAGAAPRLPQLPETLSVGSPQQLIRRRPDVQAAERQLAAETMLVGAARADYLPRLTLSARAGYLATSLDSLSRTGTSRLLIGPVLTFPLFDLARVNQRAELAHARMDQARAEHDAAVSRALNESEASLVSYDRAHARLAILTEAQASSARAAELAQQRFEAGLTDLLQVLDAQRTLLEAENQLVMGHTAAATALVAVYKAVGGTWPVR